MHASLTRVIGLLSLCWLTACSANGQPPQFEQTRLKVGGQTVHVEIADSDDTRQYGLMNRQYLPFNEGMWFVFGFEFTHCMWMKNTLIDLDVAFVNNRYEIVNIEAMQAGSTEIHCANEPVSYALEMNKGWFAQHDVTPGVKVHMLGAGQ